MNDLDIFRTEFLPAAEKHKRVSMESWSKSAPADYARWIAYRDGLLRGESPAPPSMTTEYGKHLVAAGKLVTQEAANEILAYQVQATASSQFTSWFVTHDSPTTEWVGDGLNGDKRRIIRWSNDGQNPSSQGGLYVPNKTTYALLGFRQVAYSSYRSFDWHTQPNDLPHGWYDVPPVYGVAPFALDIYEDSHSPSGANLVIEPEYPNHIFRVLSAQDLVQHLGQWIWIWLEIKWGRRDLAAKGGVKAWLSGEDIPRVDAQGISTHWPDEHQITFWEGAYDSTGFNQNMTVEIAATRFGRTPKECYEDVPKFYSEGARGSANGRPIAPRSSTEAQVPVSLRWM